MRIQVRPILIDFGVFLAATLGTYVAQGAERPITAVLIYLSGVIVIAVHSGLFSALSAALAASIVFNFFLSAPVFEFGVTTADEAVPLIAFNATAVLTGILVGRLKDTAKRASSAQSETEFLLTVSDRLQSALTVDDIESVIRAILPPQRIRWVKIFVDKGDCFLRPSTGEVELYPFTARSKDAASQSDPVINLELTGARGTIGIARFQLIPGSGSDTDFPDLSSISALVALAIERCLLLEELAEAVARARSEILKDSLLSSVSHDLRTPLTVIEAAAGALRSPEIRLPEEERANLLNSIIEQCHRLDRYTSELIDVGRIQAGISPTTMELVDMVEVVSLALRQIRTLYPNLQIRREVVGDAFLISARPAMVEQAAFNALDNAAKYAGNAPIDLSLKSHGGHVELEIIDRGDGIPTQALGRIFERFYKGEKGAADGGTGLGLFIAKGFVEACGGSISAHSPANDGRGTRITIRFPAVPSESDTASADIDYEKMKL